MGVPLPWENFCTELVALALGAGEETKQPMHQLQRVNQYQVHIIIHQPYFPLGAQVIFAPLLHVLEPTVQVGVVRCHMRA